jgi:hypothetical protein
MFAAVDPYTWRKYRDVYVRMASEFRLVEECDPNRIQWPLYTHQHVDDAALGYERSAEGVGGHVVVGDFSEEEPCRACKM